VKQSPDKPGGSQERERRREIRRQPARVGEHVRTKNKNRERDETADVAEEAARPRKKTTTPRATPSNVTILRACKSNESGSFPG